MPHPSSDPATVARREAEFAKARSAYELDQLQAKWQSEDRVAAAAADWRAREVAELRQRVAVLERAVGPGGKALIDVMVKALGQALGEMRQRDRVELLAEVEQKGFVRYSGTWDEGADYARGAMVTHAGSTWIATGPCVKGARPGRAAEWRLATKSGEADKRIVTV